MESVAERYCPALSLAILLTFCTRNGSSYLLLSIIIPSYNHEKFVLSTIRAAVRIDVRDKEILVIDDGSTDDSVRILREYIAGEGAGANVRLIARENRGLVRTLNEALRMSAGKYFYAVASDDIPIPEGVASLVDHLENNPGLEFVLGNALFMESEEQREFQPAYGAAHRRFFGLPQDVRREEMYLNYPQPLLLQASVFKTSTLQAIGGWREDIVVDDYSLFLRMLGQFPNAGKDFDYCPEIATCFYRMHATNSWRNEERQFRMIEQALAKLCPAEWRDAALVKNFVLHGMIALKHKRPRLAARFLRSTVRHVGFLRSMVLSVSEVRRWWKERRSRRRTRVVEPLVEHDSADAIAGRSS